MRLQGFLFAFVIVAAAVAGCGGGGGGGSTTPPTTSPSSPPTSSPTTAPSASVTVGSSSQSATVAAGGTTAAVTVPAASSGTATVTIAASATLPSGLAPLARHRSSVQQTACTSTFAGLSLSWTASSTITLSGIPQLTITLPSSVSTSGVAFYIGYLAPGATAWQEPLLGPASVSGQTLTFSTASIPLTLTAGQTYQFALYTQPMNCGPGPVRGGAYFGNTGHKVTGAILGSANTNGFTAVIAGTLDGTAYAGTLSGTISGSTVTGTVTGTGISSGTFSGPVAGGVFSAAGSFAIGAVTVAFNLDGGTAPGLQQWNLIINEIESASNITDVNAGGVMSIDSNGNVAGSGTGTSADTQGTYCVDVSTFAGSISGTTLTATTSTTNLVAASTIPPNHYCLASGPGTITASANTAFPSATTISAYFTSYSPGSASSGCMSGSVGANSVPPTCVPSPIPSASPTTSPSSSASPSSSPSPTSSPSSSPSWTFGGSTTTTAFTSGQTPAASNLSAYQGVTLNMQWSAPTSGTASATFTDALNNGDITPNTLPADNATSGYTPVLYLSIVPTAQLTFGATPSVTISGISASYTTCNLDSYDNSGAGGALVWTARLAGSASGGTATFTSTSLSGTGQSIKWNGQQVLAFSCK